MPGIPFFCVPMVVRSLTLASFDSLSCSLRFIVTVVVVVVVIVTFVDSAIVAGTPLRGRVIVHVKKGVDRCNSVTLEVSGKEMTAAYQYLEYDKSVHPYNRHGDDDDEDHHRKLM